MTTYKTQVALEKPCKERKGTPIGQPKDRQVSKYRAQFFSSKSDNPKDNFYQISFNPN
jgi:hypothetical protein